MQKFFDSNAWRWTKTILEILGILLGIALLIFLYHSAGFAEEEQGWVICSPGDYVNVRKAPSIRSESIGRYETGDSVKLDGKKRNGFLHCTGLGLEESEGWIHSGHVVFDQPEMANCNAVIVSKGRLAARKNVGGKRTRWLKSGAELKVYYWSSEWSVTNCGYVQSRYLEMDGGGR